MPVRFQKECESGAHILVWKATESETELFTSLPSTILTDAEYEATPLPHKRMELLTSRVAIRHLAQQLGFSFDGIKKDENGKPYLVNTHWQMSITHSKHFMGVIMHPNLPVGIDIEKPQEKMWRIKKRLYSEQEILDIGEDLNRMSIYWSAKEALYKLYGKRGTDFIKNLRLSYEGNQLMGEIMMEDYRQKHRVLTEPIDNYILVWVV